MPGIQPTQKINVKDFLKKTSGNYKEKINIPKEILKWAKRLLYLFLFAMALIGCFQQFIDPSIQTSNFPGAGSEIAWPGEAINGYIVDPSTGQIYAYNPITNWGQAWSHGPFYGLFVFPFSLFIMSIMDSFSYSQTATGLSVILSIFLLVFIIRTLTLIFTIPQLKLQAHMQTVQLKIAEIKAKYPKDLTSVEKQRQTLEIMSLYKKNDFKPMSLFSTTFVTLPFFYAMYRCTAMVRDIKTSVLGPFSFNVSTWHGLSSLHNWWYLIPFFILIPVQILSIKIQAILNYKQNKKMDAKSKKQYRKSQMIFNIMAIFLVIVSMSVSLSLATYWFFSNLYTIFQSIGIFYYQKHSKNKKMRLKT